MTDPQIRSHMHARMEDREIAASFERARHIAEKEYRSTRLTIAATIYTNNPYRHTADESVRLAEQIMAANQSAPIPPGALAQYTTYGPPHVA